MKWLGVGLLIGGAAAALVFGFAVYNTIGIIIGAVVAVIGVIILRFG